MSAKRPDKAGRPQLSHLTLLSATCVRATDPKGRPVAGEGAARRGRRRPELSGSLFRGHGARRGRLGGTRGGVFTAGLPDTKQEWLRSYFKRKPSLLVPSKTPASLGRRRLTEEGQKSYPGTCHPERAGRAARRGAAAVHRPLRPPGAASGGGRRCPPSRRAGPAPPCRRRRGPAGLSPSRSLARRRRERTWPAPAAGQPRAAEPRSLPRVPLPRPGAPRRGRRPVPGGGCRSFSAAGRRRRRPPPGVGAGAGGSQGISGSAVAAAAAAEVNSSAAAAGGRRPRRGC